MKDWIHCPYYSLDVDIGLCSLVPLDEWQLCYWELDYEELCPKPEDIPERELKQEGAMTENIKQMRERHKREIEELRSRCRHRKSTWWDVTGLPGSYGKSRVCDRCGKTLETKFLDYSGSITISNAGNR